MPSFRRRASVIDASRVDEPKQESDRPADATEALALAEQAEAEAAEAEAVAAAARAKARAIRLRKQAEEAAAAATQTAPAETEPATETVPESLAKEAEPIEAATPDDADDPVVAAIPIQQRGRGRILKIVAAALVAVLAVAGTAVLILLSLQMYNHHRQQAADDQRRAEYSAAARQSVVTLMSLDFNKAKEDVQRIIDNSTGQFKDDFKSQADDFIKVAQDSKVITEVTVNATGVESMTDDTALVLVSASSRVTNSAGAKQEPRSWRLSVDLRREGGQIKMEKVEFVP